MRRFLLIFAFSAAIAAAQEQGKEAEAGEKDLGWKIANFAILVVGLGYLISKNLPPVFRARTEEIQRGIVEAQARRKDAEARAAEMDRKLAALGEEIEKFRTQARAEMQQESARIAESTRHALEKIKQQTELEIETAGKVAQRELKSFAAKLSLDLAETRIRARLDAGSERALIQDFVADLSRSSGEASKN